MVFHINNTSGSFGLKILPLKCQNFFPKMSALRNLKIALQYENLGHWSAVDFSGAEVGYNPVCKYLGVNPTEFSQNCILRHILPYWDSSVIYTRQVQLLRKYGFGNGSSGTSISLTSGSDAPWGWCEPCRWSPPGLVFLGRWRDAGNHDGHPGGPLWEIWNASIKMSIKQNWCLQQENSGH